MTPTIDGKTVTVLADGLGDSVDDARVAAILLLSEIGVDAAPARVEIVRALRDSNAAVRSTAVEALYHIGPMTEGELAVMQDLLGDTDRTARLEALTALSKQAWKPTPGANERITRLLASERVSEVSFALDAIATMSGPERSTHVSRIADLVRDPRDFVWASAIRAIDKCVADDPSIVRYLDAVRSFKASAYLGVATVYDGRGLESTWVESAWRQGLDSADASVRVASIRRVSETDRASSAIVERIVDHLLRDLSSEVRVSAARFFLRSGGATVAHAKRLVPALADKEPAVAIAIGVALLRVRAIGSNDLSTPGTPDSSPARLVLRGARVQSRGRYATDDVDAFSKALSDADQTTRMRACWVCAAIGIAEPRILDLLHGIRCTQRQPARGAALDALEDLTKSDSAAKPAK